MGKTFNPEFTHRTNEDGTIHSYCSRCFATVADSASRSDLDTAELAHKCDPRLLEMVDRYRAISRLRSVA